MSPSMRYDGGFVDCRCRSEARCETINSSNCSIASRGSSGGGAAWMRLPWPSAAAGAGAERGTPGEDDRVEEGTLCGGGGGTMTEGATAAFEASARNVARTWSPYGSNVSSTAP